MHLPRGALLFKHRVQSGHLVTTMIIQMKAGSESHAHLKLGVAAAVTLKCTAYLNNAPSEDLFRDCVNAILTLDQVVVGPASRSQKTSF